MRSCAILLGGALLLSTAAASAQTPPLAPAPAPVAPLPAHQSRGMMIAGILLTGVASALVLATVSVVACCNKDNSDGISTAGTLGPILGLSSILPAAVGIPLWVTGARAPVPAPTVSGGPGGVALVWRF